MNTYFLNKLRVRSVCLQPYANPTRCPKTYFEPLPNPPINPTIKIYLEGAVT
ncbi:hypothetical protein Hanom_Chr16g01488271 [Helianthus anomalus]